jgi:hypothetical protein
MVTGKMTIVDTFLSLLCHWLESHRTSDRWHQQTHELTSSALIATMQQLLSNHATALCKSQLLRLCHLLMLLERERGVTIAVSSQRPLFKSCLEQQVHPSDFAASEWSWLWNTELTTTEGRQLQQEMVRS